MHAAGHGAHLAGRGLPDRQHRYEARRHADPECECVSAISIEQRACGPRSDRAAEDGAQHQRAEDAAVVLALENLGDDGGEHRRNAVAEYALRQHHQIEHGRVGNDLQQQEKEVAKREAEHARCPHPLAADAVRDVAKRNLPRNADEADEAQRPGCHRRAEADLGQVLGLMHLDGVPGVEPTEVAKRNPPEAGGLQGARQGPVHCRPGRVDHIGARGRGR